VDRKDLNLDSGYKGFKNWIVDKKDLKTG